MLSPARATQRGLSIVELLVGVAIGLFIVAGGSKLLAENLIGNRRVIVESRISQDLRAATDIIARDIRRAGFWQNAITGVAASSVSNAYRIVEPTPASGVASSVQFSYSRDTAEDNAVSATNETFGYDRVVVDGVGIIRSNVGGNMQALTDPSSVDVTLFEVTPIAGEVSLGQACRNNTATGPACCQPHPTSPSMCKGSSVQVTPLGMTPASAVTPASGVVVSASCPELVIRRFEIRVQGTGVSPNRDVIREIRETVRVRNDELRNLACP